MKLFKLPLLKAIPGLLVVLAGVGLAWLAFRQSLWLGSALAATPIACGLVTFWWGKSLLAKHKPVEALKFLECGVLVPGTVVAIVAGQLIGAGVFLETAEAAGVETKKLLAASLAAIGGFLTASSLRRLRKRTPNGQGSSFRRPSRTLTENPSRRKATLGRPSFRGAGGV